MIAGSGGQFILINTQPHKKPDVMVIVRDLVLWVLKANTQLSAVLIEQITNGLAFSLLNNKEEIQKGAQEETNKSPITVQAGLDPAEHKLD